MDKAEFESKLKELELKYSNDKKMLYITYARSNNPYNIGDKVSDNSHTILIDKMQVHLGFHDNPCMVYTGKLLNKDGSVNKKLEHKPHAVYQSNINK